ELLAGKVTVVEMICASACVTSMVRFTSEKRCRYERTFDMETGSNARRMAARDTATSFPVPWADMLAQLSAVDEAASEETSPDLPCAGAELAGIVSVILKSGGDYDAAVRTANFVQQTLVRRGVVARLAVEAQLHGHRAYKQCSFQSMT
ncbi:unnamed protein product, partial [Prorocentrum cordatum]